MIRKVFDILRIPHWLTYYALYSEPNNWLSPIRFVCGLFDLRPRMWCRKVNLMVRSASLSIPKIGHVHIPKTGGTYASSVQRTFPHVNFSHVLVRTDRGDKYCPVGLTPINPHKVSGYFLLANVRNPLSFLVSYYHHVKGFDNHHNPRHYDYHLAEKGFEFLVETIINRTDKWPSRKFLFPQLFDQSNACIVDWINRNEFLDSDLANLAKLFGLSFEAGRRKRVAPKQKPFDEYYSGSLLEKASSTYSREMVLFGYVGTNTTTPLIELQPLQKKRIRYDYIGDKLYFDDKVIEYFGHYEATEDKY